MPYVKKITVVRLPLPSSPSYWVDWRETMRYGDMKIAMKQAVEIEDGEMKTDTSAMSDALLLAHLDAWNLDDEAGTILPLTTESLELLVEEDVQFLLGKAQEGQKEEEKRRKKEVTSSTRSSSTR